MSIVHSIIKLFLSNLRAIVTDTPGGKKSFTSIASIRPIGLELITGYVILFDCYRLISTFKDWCSA